MFTCTNAYNQILTIRLCEAHEFEWRRHDPGNNHTTYKYPGMDEFVVKGFIDGDTFIKPFDSNELDHGRQWLVIDEEWDSGNFKGLRKGDIITIDRVDWTYDDTRTSTFNAWVQYDNRMSYMGDDAPDAVMLFTERDVDAGRIRFYK